MEDTRYDREMTVKLLERQAERLLDVMEMLKGKDDLEAVRLLTPASTALIQARARLMKLGSPPSPSPGK